MSVLLIIIATLKFIFPWVLAIVMMLGLLWIYSSTYKNGKFRGVVTYLGHLSVFGLGWILGRWVGIFLISFPVLIFYYYMLFHLAMVVVPTSDPF